MSSRPILLIEYESTRDMVVPEPYGWRTVPVPPTGRGWVISDDTHDRRTRWRRISLVDQDRCPASRGGRG